MPKKHDLSVNTAPPVSVRFSPEVMAALREAAKKEFRTPTDFIRKAVVEALRACGAVA